MTDTEEVLDQWKNDFSSLYNPVINKNSDNATNEAIMSKDVLEAESYINQNEQPNGEISLVEIQLALTKCKNKKASGFDKILNEEHEALTSQTV